MRLIAHYILIFVCSGALWASERASIEGQKNPAIELAPLRAFIDLTDQLNSVADSSGVSVRIAPIGTLVRWMSRPEGPALSPQKGKKVGLPALTTDDSQINSVDLKELGLSGLANISGVAQIAQDALRSEGLTPLPMARMVSPVGERSVQEPLDAPLKSTLKANEPDVIGSLAPVNTRFGKDKYDQSVFTPTASPASQGFGPAPESVVEGNQSDANQFLANNGNDSEESQDPKKKNQLQEARENFQKTMLEFAERTEDKEAFRLVDYYDLKNVLAKNEHLLGMFENEEFDERFVKNAQVIFDRFADKDSAVDKKPFERFLKRLAPPEEAFGSLNSNPTSGLGSRRNTHRPQSQ
ncbi:hypothetical protein EBQ90_06915 [bacterium]|nr:hypothetical protein [bacterium]